MENRILVEAHENIVAPAWLGNVQPFIDKVFDHLEIEGWEISVLFCNDEFIAGLNKEFRQVDGPTDVLSFEQGDEYVDDEDNVWFTAGDIVISLDSLAKNAHEFSVSEDEELKRLLIHGILHLDGMDHEDNSPEQEMLQYQEHMMKLYADIHIMN